MFKQIGSKKMYVLNKGGVKVLKSYDVIIAIINGDEVFLNSEFYNYSVTTARHRNLFLNVNAKEFHDNVKKGFYNFITNDEILKLYYELIYLKGVL